MAIFNKINVFLNTSITTLFLLTTSLDAQDRASNTIILDALGEKNLGIEAVEADYTDFKETLFAIGRITPLPENKGVISSRVPGRIKKLYAFEGDRVKKDQVIIDLESLQPGNPPPTIQLKAPLGGMIMQSHTHLGDPVVPDNELFEITDLSEVYAVAKIPEDQARTLGIGTHAMITIPAISEDSIDGELVFFGTTADAVSGTVDAFFKVKNEDYRIRPNMRTEFSITLHTQEDTFSVPFNAVQSDGKKRFVFVKDFDLPHAFVKAPVIVGKRNQTHIEIVSGLFPGDEVVTKGSYALVFAGGGGGISLKDALDAAHGHEHNENGSEMTAEQRQQKAAEKAGAQGGGSHDQQTLVHFLSILSGVLFFLLVLSLFAKRKPKADDA